MMNRLNCNIILILAVFLGLQLLPETCNAQVAIPSDTATYPYVVSEMVDLISSSIEEPKEENEYVQMVLKYEDFPQVSVGNTLSASSVMQIRAWVKDRPDAIEQLLIARKKNHDKYFNQ